MPQKRKNLETAVGGKFDPSLVTAFGNLAKKTGISMREALRRVMVNAVNENRVPGIDMIDVETREHAKFGGATPLYEGEPEGQKSGRKAPVGPAE